MSQTVITDRHVYTAAMLCKQADVHPATLRRHMNMNPPLLERGATRRGQGRALFWTLTQVNAWLRRTGKTDKQISR